ncbi:hypothetical protein N7532_008248 [Penicillium argentinense]|uniref:Uncharacterized protein n=1 Tax=Penicillium argentinense TaxID=1131581 RepID=A0A9W9K1F1_9EURO|nr:uncharacterized protein N7532_008248 [Penicillium argentinense]KAJ5089564.1 hypothetical protein N7532_008248 [Penicillium argentinense]
MAFPPDSGTAGTDEDQSGSDRSRFYSRPDTAQHISDNRHSGTPSDENSRAVYSDEELIYNATAEPPPPSEDNQVGQDANPVLGDVPAAHIAMFLPSDSSQDGNADTVQQQGRMPRQTRDKVWWSNLSESAGLYRPQSKPEGGGGLPVETATQRPRRNAISLDTFDGSSASPQWPANVPAVRVHRPPYPPPERIPTPPGLPSFGTPEAMAASAQFMTGTWSGTIRPTESQRTTSYGSAIRRFFGLRSSAGTGTETAPAFRTAPGIGRAADGTMVHGRFLYRQSGHGTSLARQLEDHPFHTTELPLAPVQTNASEGARTETSVTSFKSWMVRPKRHGRLYRPSIARIFADPQHSTSPEPTPSAPPRNPARNLARRGQPQSPTLFPTQDVASRHTSAMQYPPRPETFQRHGIVNETIQEETEESGNQPRNVPGVLPWARIQIPFCCCLTGNSLHESHEEHQLEVLSSRDTYQTAQSHASPSRPQTSSINPAQQPSVQHESSWMSSLNQIVRRGAAAFTQRFP